MGRLHAVGYLNNRAELSARTGVRVLGISKMSKDRAGCLASPPGV